MTGPRPADIARRLAHDVGKYVSRTARNIHELPLSPPMSALLLEDLYLLDGSRTASQVFDDLAIQLQEAIGDHPDIAACREHLDCIDASAPAVRRGEADALREVISRAISIDDTLRRLARALSEGSLS